MIQIKHAFYFFLLLFGMNACAQTNTAQKLDCKAFQMQLNATNEAVLLDVRTAGEFQSGHLPKAINLDYNASDFNEKVQLLDKNRTYFVYCAVGGRSARAAGVMRTQGFKNVLELNGGINAWQAAKLPVEK